ncbi:heterogeneous nuclear ribonucleoprotein A3 homolog 2-like [Pecten maximus]|uniref:heterogeneous nuclear ribonucleoprotein A3 homolog 2-like n=1 Tax=Pecten maximus TaxID=6579 RepID=UPI0014582B32|nr:heterogeneous nuclear ribonucleoprotein A3 homolog 2-like [Pecten maximus]
MLRVVIFSCVLVAVYGMGTSMHGKGGTYGGYGSKGGFYGYGGKGGYNSGYGGKGGYFTGYGGKGSNDGYYSGSSGKSGYGKGDGNTVKYSSQTIIPLSNPSLPSFTLEGRDTDSPYGSGVGLIAAFGAFAILFVLTRN